MIERPKSCDFSRYRHGCDPPNPNSITLFQANTPIQNPSLSSYVHCSIKRAFCIAVSGYALILFLTGCGAPSSDLELSPNARATATPSPDSAASGTAQVPEVSLGAGAEPRGQRDRLSAEQSAWSTVRSDEEGDAPSSGLNIPETIVKDLSSLDARDRYRALDYWESKDSKAPLDPVFEAMEDEDEAVRAKATAIVEQYWAEEQEKEDG